MSLDNDARAVGNLTMGQFMVVGVVTASTYRHDQ
jgi:hypothetical protein